MPGRGGTWVVVDRRQNIICRFLEHEYDLAISWAESYNGLPDVWSAGPATMRRRMGEWVVVDANGTVFHRGESYKEALTMQSSFNRVDRAVTLAVGQVDWTGKR